MAYELFSQRRKLNKPSGGSPNKSGKRRGVGGCGNFFEKRNKREGALIREPRVADLKILQSDWSRAF